MATTVLVSLTSFAHAGGFVLSAATLDRITAGHLSTSGNSDGFASAPGGKSTTQVITDVFVDETEARAYSESLAAGEEGSFADAFSVVGSSGSELSQSVEAASISTGEGATVSTAMADVSLETDGSAGSMSGAAGSGGDVVFTETTASLAKVNGTGGVAGIAAADAAGSTGQLAASEVAGDIGSLFDMNIGATSSGDDVSNAESALGGTVATSAGMFSSTADSGTSATGKGSNASSVSMLRVLEHDGMTAMFVGSVAGGSGDAVDKAAGSAITVSDTAPNAGVMTRTFKFNRANSTRSFSFAVVAPQASLTSTAKMNLGAFSRQGGG